MMNMADERRMAENEVMFREYNESTKKRFDELIDIARKEKDQLLLENTSLPLHFNCECSNENCRERIKLTPTKYGEIHKKRDHFIVLKGHEIPKIERTIAEGKDYLVVEKLIDPPETAKKLNPTNL